MVRSKLDRQKEEEQDKIQKLQVNYAKEIEDFKNTVQKLRVELEVAANKESENIQSAISKSHNEIERLKNSLALARDNLEINKSALEADRIQKNKVLF